MKARDFSFSTDDGRVHLYVNFENKKVSFSTENDRVEMDIEELDELNTKIQDEYEDL